MLSLFDIKCANCGKDDRVPFKPDSRRPVYCRECKKKYGK